MNDKASSVLEGMTQAERPTGLFLGFVVTLVSFGFTGIVPLFLGVNADNSGSFGGQFVMTASFVVWIVCIFAWVAWRERRSIASIGFRGDAAKHALIGGVLGIAMTTTVVAVNVLAGMATLGAPDWSMAGSVVVLLTGFAVQASAEEIAYRGYLVQVMATRWPVVAVVIVQAIVFTAGHVGNGLNPIAIITMLAVSYFLMMWIIATGNLWGAMAFHALWNWTQANVWGAPVSNIRMDMHIFAFTPADASPWHNLMTGGTFGLEGSIITIIFLIAGGLYFQFFYQRPRVHSE